MCDLPAIRKRLQVTANDVAASHRRAGHAAPKALTAFSFPGNVRQLENICHWITVMAPGQRIDVGRMILISVDRGGFRLRRGINGPARDLHIAPSERPFRVRLRVDGFLREIMNPQKSYHAPTVARIKVQAGLDIAERRAPQDGRIELREKGRNVDLRVSTLPTVFGEKVVLRLFDRNLSLARLEEIGFGQQIFHWYSSAVRKPHGMVLVTGPTGSGKTSTLMSTLAYLNSSEKNIVTIEDPVEYQLPGINHVQVNPKAGLTFADGLRAILRQDPNIIMIGEIRDGETADVAVRSALTGHLVLSTLHTNDAAGALTRLVDMDVEPYLIASSVLGVLAQRLLRKVCMHCREPHEVDADIFAGYGCVPAAPGKVTLYRARGCAQCNDTGYAGRFPVPGPGLLLPPAQRDPPPAVAGPPAGGATFW